MQKQTSPSRIDFPATPQKLEKFRWVAGKYLTRRRSLARLAGTSPAGPIETYLESNVFDKTYNLTLSRRNGILHPINQHVEESMDAKVQRALDALSEGQREQVEIIADRRALAVARWRGSDFSVGWPETEPFLSYRRDLHNAALPRAIWEVQHPWLHVFRMLGVWFAITVRGTPSPPAFRLDHLKPPHRIVS